MINWRHPKTVLKKCIQLRQKRLSFIVILHDCMQLHRRSRERNQRTLVLADVLTHICIQHFFSLLLFSFRLLSRLLRLCVFAPIQNDDNWRHFVKYDSGGEATSGLSGDCSTTLSRRHIGYSVYAWTMARLAALLWQGLPFFWGFLHKSANFWPLSHRSRSSQSKGIFKPSWKLLVLKKCLRLLSHFLTTFSINQN